ncbi:unnamed protein product, partial [Tetraodon nigroviridis]
RTALIAIIGFMPTKGEGAIGSLDYTPEERKALAKRYHQLESGCQSGNAVMMVVMVVMVVVVMVVMVTITHHHHHHHHHHGLLVLQDLRAAVWTSYPPASVLSQDFTCEACGCSMLSALVPLSPNSSPRAEEAGAAALAQQIRFKVE